MEGEPLPSIGHLLKCNHITAHFEKIKMCETEASCHTWEDKYTNLHTKTNYQVEKGLILRNLLHAS